MRRWKTGFDGSSSNLVVVCGGQFIVRDDVEDGGSEGTADGAGGKCETGGGGEVAVGGGELDESDEEGERSCLSYAGDDVVSYLSVVQRGVDGGVADGDHEEEEEGD